MRTHARRSTLALLMAVVFLCTLCPAVPGLALALPDFVTPTIVPVIGAYSISMPGVYDIRAVTGDVTVNASPVVLTGSTTARVIVNTANATLTLWDATLNKDSAARNGLEITENTTLVLQGTNTVNGGVGHAGVHVPTAASLRIEGPGSLTARGGTGAAGIGGNQSEDSGAIGIYSATVTATGGTASGGQGGGAGIGGGGYSVGGKATSIRIDDAVVVAVGGDGGDANDLQGGGGGAGIGGGAGSSGEGGAAVFIRINASRVTAIGGSGGTGRAGSNGGGGGAGIGGGGGGGGRGAYAASAGSALSLYVLPASLTALSSGGSGGGTVSNSGGHGGNGALAGGGGGGGGGAAGGSGGDASDDLTTYSGGAGGASGESGQAGQGLGGAAGGSGYNNHGGGGGGAGLFLTGENDGTPVTPDASGFGPTITTHPTNTATTEGGNATFTVAASGGTAPLHYWWQSSTDNGNQWQHFDSTSGATLTLSNAHVSHSGSQYRCLVYDEALRGPATSAAATLTVNAQTYALTLNAGTGGSVDTSVNGNYAAGARIPLTATPDSGYSFTGWTSDVPGAAFADATAASTTFTMPAGAANVTAAFAPIVQPPMFHPFTVAADAGGSVDTAVNGNYEAGDPIALSATPDSGYSFTGWTSDVPGAVFGDASAASTTFTMPDGAANVTAHFSSQFAQRILTHTATGITASGLFTPDAALDVVPNQLHAAGCPGCDQLRALQAAGKLAVRCDISLGAGASSGTLSLSIPLDPAKYDGQRGIVHHCVNGTLVSTPVTIANGAATAAVSSFSPFAVEAQPRAIPQPLPVTGDRFPMAGLVVLLVGLVGATGFVVRRGKKGSA